jgi:hypothetical protein
MPVALFAQEPASLCVVANDSLVMAGPDSAVYLIHAGKKYHVQSPNWVVKHGYKWAEIRKVQTAQVDEIPTGYEITESDGLPGTPWAWNDQLVAVPEGIYLVKNGERRHVSSPEWIVHSPYYGKPIVALSTSDVKDIPQGVDILYTPPKTKLVIAVLTAILLVFFWFSTYRSRYVSLESRPPGVFFAVKVLTFLAFVIAIILREPNLIAHPRFWAEEGTAWFQYAATHSPLRTLLYIYPAAGYANLVANVAVMLSAIVASVFGLEYAPLVTTLIALLFQVLPVALLLFGRSSLFDVFWKKIAGCLVLLFAPTATDEVWLCSAHSLTYLSFFALLLAFEEIWLWPRWLKWMAWGVMALGGLSGPYTVAMLPVFLLLALLYKRRETIIECAILAGCLMLQAAIVLYSVLGAGLPSRGRAHLDTSLVNVFVAHVLYPFFGAPSTWKLLVMLGLDNAWMSASSTLHAPSSTLLLGAWFSFGALVAVLWTLRGREIKSPNTVALGFFGIISTLTCVASLYGIPVTRYAVIPGFCILLLLLINIACSSERRMLTYLCMIVLSYGLANGIVDYWHPVWNGPSGGPPWSSEVRMWRADHKYGLRTWPSWWAQRIVLERE